MAQSRLSPCRRGEDEGEGSKRTRPESILTLPLSFEKGETTRYARCCTNPLRRTERASVHPTAIVDPNAKIGGDVQIGPFSIIGPHVTIGDKTVVQSHVVIEGEVITGRGNFIGHGAIIGAPPQDVSFSLQRKTKVEIGNDNIIREYLYHPPR